jgi:hypothetical protein
LLAAFFTATAVASPPDLCTYKPLKLKVVRGRVLAAGTNEPLSDVSVSVMQGRPGKVIGATTSGEDGTFVIPRIPPGTYHILFERQRFAKFGIDFHISRLVSARNGIEMGLGFAGRSCSETIRVVKFKP